MTFEHDVSKLARIRAFVLLLLVIGTPYSYLLGLSYYQGTLHAYGLSYESFPATAPDIYVTAYYAFGNFLLAVVSEVGAKANSLSFVEIMLFAIALVTAAMLAIRVNKNKQKFASRLLESLTLVVPASHKEFFLSIKSVLTKAVFGLFVIFAFFSLIMIVTLAWWAFPYWIFTNASGIQKQKIQDYLHNGCYIEEKTNWANCYILFDKDEKEIASGMLVGLSEKRISFFDSRGVTLLALPKQYQLRRYYAQMR